MTADSSSAALCVLPQLGELGACDCQSGHAGSVRSQGNQTDCESTDRELGQRVVRATLCNSPHPHQTRKKGDGVVACIPLRLRVVWGMGVGEGPARAAGHPRVCARGG